MEKSLINKWENKMINRIFIIFFNVDDYWLQYIDANKLGVI